jgi:hypothetical protein
VESHTALPDPQQPTRILSEALTAIKKSVANTSAENDPDGGKKNQVVDLPSLQRRPGFLAASSREPPGKSQSGQVGEAVPVNLEGPERNGNGIDLGVAEHACDDPVNATRGRAKALRSDATQY